MAETTAATWLTQEAYDRLKAEYEHLTGPGRTEIATRIAQARDEGDLSENGGYHAAREEQGQQEARIRQLEAMLRDAQIGEAPKSAKAVTPGMTVTICYDGDEDDTDTFLLGSREVLGLDDSVTDAVYSPQSPIGAAILGQRKGATVSYEAPNGKSITVQILDVEPFTP